MNAIHHLLKLLLYLSRKVSYHISKSGGGTKLFGGAILFLAMMLVAACGRGEEPEPMAEPVTLTMVSITDDSNGEQVALDQYVEAHAHVTIKRNGYSQFPSAYILSDTPPDIMSLGPSNILAAATRQDLLVDLTDVWAQSGLLESYPAPFRDMSEYDGKHYFVPTGYSWIGIYYNVAIFEQFGLETPQTWDELMTVADQLLAGGETPFAISGQNPIDATLWFDYLNLRLNGPEFHRGLLRGAESYDDVRVRQVFEVWQDLFAREYFVSDANYSTTLDSLTAVVRTDEGQLNSDKAVMVLASPFTLTDLPDQFRRELDFFRFPVIDPSLNQGEVVPTIGYMIPATSPNREEALELVAYLASPEAQEMLFQPDSNQPTFVPASSEVVQDNFSAATMRGMSIVQEATHATPQYFWNSPFTVQQRIGSTMSSFFRTVQREGVDIDKILIQLEEARQTALNQQEFAN